jgi:hypothetical protein
VLPGPVPVAEGELVGELLGAGPEPAVGFPAGDRPVPEPADGVTTPDCPAGCLAAISVMTVCGATCPLGWTASTVPGDCRLGSQMTRTGKPSWRSRRAAESTGRPSSDAAFTSIVCTVATPGVARLDGAAAP